MPGLRRARSGARDEFRGWGGSSHPDVTVSPNGFSSDAAYLANPRLHRQGKTTRGFEPGTCPARRVGGRAGCRGGRIPAGGRLRREGRLARRDRYQRPTRSGEATHTRPRPMTTTPAQAGPGWYAGDFHVHAEHSSLGDATMREAFDYAFRPARAGRRRTRLHHAVGLRHRHRLGRDRPLPARLSRQADRAQRRGHHLPRAREQPRQRCATSTTAPGPSTSAGEDGTLRAAARAARPAERALRRGARGRRLHADQPPHDLPLRGAGLRLHLPRLPLGLHRRRDRLREGRRDRGRDRAGRPEGGPAAGPEPVHPARDPVLGGRDRRRRPEPQQDRRGRLERLPQRGPHAATRSPSRRSGRRPRSSTRTSCRSAASSAASRPATPTSSCSATTGPTCASRRGRRARAGRRRSWATRSQAAGSPFTARVLGAGPGAARAGTVHAVRAEGRRAVARRAGHDRRRLHVRLPERRPRPIPPPASARTARSRRSRARSTSNTWAIRAREARPRCASRWSPPTASAWRPTGPTARRSRSAHADRRARSRLC